MILVRIKAGSKPGIPTFIKPEEIERIYTKTVKRNEEDQLIQLESEFIWWAKDGNGRLGSIWQTEYKIGDRQIYIKVLDENDDYTKYYHSIDEPITSGNTLWGIHSGTTSCSGNCKGCK